MPRVVFSISQIDSTNDTWLQETQGCEELLGLGSEVPASIPCIVFITAKYLKMEMAVPPFF